MTPFEVTPPEVFPRPLTPFDVPLGVPFLSLSFPNLLDHLLIMMNSDAEFPTMNVKMKTKTEAQWEGACHNILGMEGSNVFNRWDKINADKSSHKNLHFHHELKLLPIRKRTIVIVLHCFSCTSKITRPINDVNWISFE